jgi:vacuolar-type H+-ATPase subunit H
MKRLVFFLLIATVILGTEACTEKSENKMNQAKEETQEVIASAQKELEVSKQEFVDNVDQQIDSL